jgi:hypothetical protein
LQLVTTVDTLGDAKSRLEFRMPTAKYGRFKTACPNTAVLLRKLHLYRDWEPVTAVAGQFLDATNTVIIEFTRRGMARSTSDGLWQIRFEEKRGGEVIGVFGNVAVLREVVDTGSVPLLDQFVPLTHRIEVAAPNTDVKILDGGRRITYRRTAIPAPMSGTITTHPLLPPASSVPIPAGASEGPVLAPNGAHRTFAPAAPATVPGNRTPGGTSEGPVLAPSGVPPSLPPSSLPPAAPVTVLENGPAAEVEFFLDSKPRLMSCLAKLYGNSKFDKFWAARSIARNTGDQQLLEYRVRFRIDGFSDWSDWSRSYLVAPGQTVVDAYFPAMDLKKTADLDSGRSALLQAEYEYIHENGLVARDQRVRTIEMLSRSQAVHSTMPVEAQADWYDRRDCDPYIVASFVTADDPVIQRVCGIVSQQAGGNLSASGKDKDSRAFVKGVYDFMRAAGIVYQTPPGGSLEGLESQDFRLGRDVLANRAGTCVDLAILFASVCEAAGMDCFVVVIPRHADPAVRLPESGKFVAVHTTRIAEVGFEKAAEEVTEQQLIEYVRKELAEELRRRGDLVDVDPRDLLLSIRSMRSRGVHGLELPPVGPNSLSQLCEVPQLHTANFPGVPIQQPNVGDVGVPAAGGARSGKWVFQGRIGEWDICNTLTLLPTGQYLYHQRSVSAAKGIVELSDSGTYTVMPSSILLVSSRGGNRFTASFQGQQLGIFYSSSQTNLIYQKVE